MISVGAHAAALALVVAEILVRALRLRLLLVDNPLPLRQAIAVNALGDAASAVTPARLGGEPARFIGLGRHGIPGAARVVALATERVVDLSLAAVVGAAVVVFLGGRGFGDVSAIAARLTSDRAFPWLLGVAVAVVVSIPVALRLRHRLPVVVEHSVRDAVAIARRLPRAKLAGAVALTAVSMAARVAILLVLLAGTGVLGAILPAAVGSFSLLYAQVILPIPAGAGGVDLGFVAGVSPLATAAQTAALLVTWRIYTLVLPAGLGLVTWFVSRKPQAESGPLNREPKAASRKRTAEPRAESRKPKAVVH